MIIVNKKLSYINYMFKCLCKNRIIIFVIIIISFMVFVNYKQHEKQIFDENMVINQYDKKNEIEELLLTVYKDIIDIDINSQNCEMLKITPSYEWLIKEVSAKSLYDAEEMVDKLVKSFLGEINVKSNGFFYVTDFSYEHNNESIEEINTKMVNSLAIGSEIYGIECNKEFLYIEEVYYISGSIQYSEYNEISTENFFSGIVVSIGGKYYMYEYYIQ